MSIRTRIERLRRIHDGIATAPDPSALMAARRQLARHLSAVLAGEPMLATAEALEDDRVLIAASEADRRRHGATVAEWAAVGDQARETLRTCWSRLRSEARP